MTMPSVARVLNENFCAGGITNTPASRIKFWKIFFRWLGIDIPPDLGLPRIPFSVNRFTCRLSIVIWIGINNVAWVPDLERAITVMFETLEYLYSNEARKFVFVNVPPIDRSPEGMLTHGKKIDVL